jgi:hypothetical protein
MMNCKCFGMKQSWPFIRYVWRDIKPWRYSARTYKYLDQHSNLVHREHESGLYKYFVQWQVQVNSQHANCVVLICGSGAMVPPVRKGKGKGKIIPLEVWTGPEGSRKLRLSAYLDNQHMKTAFTPQESFLVLISVRGCQPQVHSAAGRIMSMKNSIYTIGSRTCNLPTCSAVPQPAAPPRTPTCPYQTVLKIWVSWCDVAFKHNTKAYRINADIELYQLACLYNNLTLASSKAG